jgi:O-antigen biosynthesis protein
VASKPNIASVSKPKILLSNNTLSGYAGSELVTFELATEFLRRGYAVTIATFEKDDSILVGLTDLNVTWLDLNLAPPISHKSFFDLIWAHHFTTIDAILMDLEITAKAVIFSSLSPYEPLECPPTYASQLSLLLANSVETRDQLVRYGLPSSKIHVFPNPVASEWFAFPSTTPNVNLTRLAVVSNHVVEELNEAILQLRGLGLVVEIFGIGHNYQRVTPELMSTFDCVITIGRTVQQAMVLGLPVYCYDRFGGPGYLKSENVENASQFNFSGRCSAEFRNAAQIAKEITENYKSAITTSTMLRSRARKKYQLSDAVNQVIKRIDVSTIELSTESPSFIQSKRMRKHASVAGANLLFVQLYLDNGIGISESTSIKTFLQGTPSSKNFIDLVFDIPDPKSIVDLRLDPLNTFMVATIARVELVNPEGRVDITSLIESNANYRADDMHFFIDNDPQIFFPNVTIKGVTQVAINLKYHAVGNDALQSYIKHKELNSSTVNSIVNEKINTHGGEGAKDHAFAMQLFAIQQSLENQYILQAIKYDERELSANSQLAMALEKFETQSNYLVQRERNFSEQLQTLQKTHAQNTNEQNRLHSEREQTHLSQLAQGRTVIETQWQEMTQRERYFSEQLQKIEQRNAKLINDSRSDNLEREKNHNAQIFNLNAYLSNQQNQWAAIQKEIASQSNALRNKAEAIVSTRFWRWSAPIRRIANLFGHESPASALYGLISEARIVTFSDYPQNLAFNNNVDSTSLSPTLPHNNNHRIVDMSSTNFDIAASSLENFLSQQDEQFVFSAYRTLLGRSPDPDGLGYYLSRLRAGVEKIEIIAQLRLSNEGKSREVKIAGLEVLIRSHLRQRRTLWNRVLRIYGSKNYETARSLRAIENRVYLLDEQVKKNVAALNESFRRMENSIQNQERNEIQAHRKFDKTSQISIAANEIETHPFIDKNLASSQIQSDLNLKIAVTSDTDKSDADKIKVTVVILTKNPGPIFKEVLISALNQDTPWKYETLVVDSGSTDGTIEFVRSFADVRLLEIKSSEFGHGRTRNFAVSMAKGQYVAMLTHDAKPMNQNWLVNLVKPLEGNTTVAGVFGRHKAYPEHTHYIKRDMEMHFNGFLQWPAVMGIEDPERYAREEGYRQLLHFFSDNNACLRKEIWRKIPYPDVNFAEDQLWAKAIIEAGYKRAYADDAIVYHSHDYSIKDTFRRSFDESRALKTLFGYDLCPSARHGVHQMYACAKSDLNFLSESVGIRKALGLALKTPFLHVAKQSGWFIGRYQGKLQAVLFWLFSLDGAKKRQSNMSLLNKIKSIFSTPKELASSNAVHFDQPPLVEAKQQAPGHNKTDVIGFYDFVITKDAGCLPITSKVLEEKTINWFIPDFGIGSGGHLNIFRFIQMLEKEGYKSTICIVGAHRHESPFQARALITEHFFKLQAEVVFGAKNLGSACYSFATSWITAYALKGFSATAHKLYFVQDFEPAFYSQGSEFDFAEETYKFGFTGVCAGNWLANKLTADYGMKCHTIGFSYDRDLYQQTHRREPHKQRVFCYCRPPTVRRGWESAMLALSLVGQKMPDVEFIFAGWDMGNYHFPYEHLNAGVCKLTELPDLFSQCDAALVFSFTNLSLLPLELMSCGCVVVSNRAPNTEWLLNDGNSVLPKSSAPRAIADAIIDVLTDTKKRTDLAARAKKFASSTNWETEGKRLEKVLIGLNQ